MDTKPLTPDSNDPRYSKPSSERPIHPAYGAHRLPEVLNTNPSHQPHECCGRIFPDKPAFDAHFAAVHVPFTTDAQGKQVANPSYVEPGKDVASVHHVGLPHAEHRAGGLNEQGHSTGLKATEKYIPIPDSGTPATVTDATAETSKEWGKPPATDKPAAKGWDTKSK